MQVFNYLFGSLTRIYTTLQEVDDKLILSGFIGGFVLNVVLAAQMVCSRESNDQKLTLRGREQMLTASRYTIGTVQQQQRMQGKLVRSQPTSLWATAPEPQPKGRDPRPAAEDSYQPLLWIKKYRFIPSSTALKMIIYKTSISTEFQSHLLQHLHQQQIIHPTPSPSSNHSHQTSLLWIYRHHCPPKGYRSDTRNRSLKFPPLRNQPAFVPSSLIPNPYVYIPLLSPKFDFNLAERQ